METRTPEHRPDHGEDAATCECGKDSTVWPRPIHGIYRRRPRPVTPRKTGWDAALALALSIVGPTYRHRASLFNTLSQFLGDPSVL